MVKNFEDQTQPLTETDLQVLPWLIKGLSNRTKSNPIIAGGIVEGMNILLLKHGMKASFSDVKLRKMANHIRRNGLLPLIATSRGYYCSNESEEVQSQIDSLNERARSLIECAKGLQKFL